MTVKSNTRDCIHIKRRIAKRKFDAGFADDNSTNRSYSCKPLNDTTDNNHIHNNDNQPNESLSPTINTPVHKNVGRSKARKFKAVSANNN